MIVKQLWFLGILTLASVFSVGCHCLGDKEDCNSCESPVLFGDEYQSHTIIPDDDSTFAPIPDPQ
jgi:hypothetical protein|tara:strand:- start:425 stop:619 length:195 start_codon:yes stop_codon:yes gene_type:complete